MWDVGVIPDATVEAQAQDGARSNVNATSAAVVTRTLKSQLAQIGYRPADITFVAISHGRWAVAVRTNPAGPFVYVFFWLLLINRVSAATGRKVLLITERGGVYLFLWFALLAQWMARRMWGG